MITVIGLWEQGFSEYDQSIEYRIWKQTIAAFDVALRPTGKIYKRFWIIRVGDSRIMADSVTGNMHQLSASAA